MSIKISIISKLIKQRNALEKKDAKLLAKITEIQKQRKSLSSEVENINKKIIDYNREE